MDLLTAGTRQLEGQILLDAFSDMCEDLRIERPGFQWSDIETEGDGEEVKETERQKRFDGMRQRMASRLGWDVIEALDD